MLSFTSISQNITYNKVYNPYNKVANSIGMAIQKKGSGYVAVAVGSDTLNDNRNNIIINEIDSIGNLTKIITFHSDTADYWAGNHGSFINTRDSGYLIAGSIQYSDTISNHLLIKFNSNMDTLWTKQIGHGTIWEVFWQVCETYDKGFACIGYRVVTPSRWDVLIFKTDSLGNKLWEKTITTTKWGMSNKIMETPDNGLLISGYRCTTAQDDGDPFVLKTDSAGNLLWMHFLGSNQLDGEAAIAITNQGDYLVSYGYSTYTYDMNDAFLARLNIIKYAPNGTQIWNKMYDSIRANYAVRKIQVYTNNDFIIMGVNSEDTLNYYYLESFLFKFNENGDSLWRKEYFYSENYNLGEVNSLNDNVLNPDGSITACGVLFTITMTPVQKIWIVQTDSNGFAPLSFYTDISKIDKPKMDIKIYPNPATNQTTIAYPQLIEEGSIHIYNMLGQIVYEEKIGKGSSQTKLSIQHLKTGIYKIIVKEKGIIKGQKSLIKE